MVDKFISVKNIVEGIYRDYEHSKELPIWDVIEWAAEALEFIGAGTQYLDMVKELCVEDHKVCLPTGYSHINQISYNGVPMAYASGTLQPNSYDDNSTNVVKGETVSNNNFPLNDTSTAIGIHTYYINDNYVITSFEEGCILLSYKGIAVDEEGFPKIPDKISYRKAIQIYVQMQMDRKDWRAGKLSQAAYIESKQDWQWYAGQARGAALMPSPDKMESIKNSWVRLKPRMNENRTFYQNMGNRNRPV